MLYIDDNDNIVAPFYTPSVEQQKDINRSTLFSFEGPFELLHADIAYIKFFTKSAVDPNPKYCLLFDRFTSKIYTHPMKNRSLLKKKMNFFIMILAKKRRESKNENTNRSRISAKQNNVENF